jgi:pyrroloquinoline quinone (PQQ) biosynthesis protein C
MAEKKYNSDYAAEKFADRVIKRKCESSRWSDFYGYSSDGHGYDSFFEDDGDYDYE